MFMQVALITTLTMMLVEPIQEVGDSCSSTKCYSFKMLNTIYFNCTFFKGNITMIPKSYINSIFITCEGDYQCCELQQIDVLNIQIFVRKIVIHNCALTSKLLSCTSKVFSRYQNLSSLSVFNVTGENLKVANTSGLYKTIPDKMFQGLFELFSLSIERSHIFNMTPKMFHDLHKLHILSVKHCPLKIIDQSSFTSMMELNSLSLIGNEIQELPAGLFKGLAELRNIHIRDNRVPLHLKSELLAELPGLASVIIVNCGLKTIPKGLLKKSHSIKEISFSRNKLLAIPKELLEDQENLLYLDLSHNFIKLITSDMFTSQARLLKLTLDDNHIEELPDLIFSNLSELRILSITNNQLRYIGPNAFTAGTLISMLQTILLSGNQLKLSGYLDDSNSYSQCGWYTPFQELIELEYLDLSRNLIEDKAIIGNVWYFSPILQKVNLSSNHISQLNIFEDETWNQKIVIDFRNNNITHVTSPNESRSFDFNPQILLGSNPLYCDCHLLKFILRYHLENGISADTRCAAPEMFKDLLVTDFLQSGLKCQLDSGECPYECNCTLGPTFDIKLELNCKALPPSINFDEFLSLNLKSSSLSLQVAPESLVVLSTHVRQLRLTGLQLRHAPRAPVPPSLDLLDLSNNSLINAPIELLNSSGTLSLRLENNPLMCDCSHVESLMTLKNNRHRIIDYKNVKCDSGNALVDVDMEQLCSPKITVVILSALAGLCVVIILVIVLFFAFENEMKVYLYSRGLCRWIHEEDTDRDKIYDAFVTFSHRDACFVIGELVPKLEQEPNPYKLCLHYRDWLVGEWIPTQIINSVNQSRRTIVVLSENFLASEWTRHEFRAAHASSLREGRARVIVILLDDVIDDKRLGLDLRTYLSTNTYIRRDDPWFWKRLRYALPHRHGNGSLNETGQ